VVGITGSAVRVANIAVSSDNCRETK
jgi:hypothetical protein